MAIHPPLLHIAKLLLSEDDDHKAPEILLRHVLEAIGADRGFIVVRQDGKYERRFAVDYDHAAPAERKFSHSLVKQAIETRKLIHLWNTDASRFSMMKSLVDSDVMVVIAAPLVQGEDVIGVVYLEYRRFPSGQDEEIVAFVSEFADLAGLCLKRALERDSLRRRTQSLENDLLARHDFQGIVGRHPKMVALLRAVAQVAESGATVLVRGETGTGKELIARALHMNSARSHKPLVTLHTSALPGTILESELFGHVKGAFTGADRDRSGRVASAHGGTLFLDEVAEIALEVQAKLLRFLQFGEIQRVGSDRTEKVDVRVVAATHQDLPALVEAGRFRRDLYFRLKVIEVEIPPLRERKSDVPLLVDHFLTTYWKRPEPRPRFTAKAERVLREHSYPGNVRELAHAVERACVLATGPELDIDLFPADMVPPPGAETSALPAPQARFTRLDADELSQARDAGVSEIEKAFLAALLEKHGGNVSLAARESGLHRTYLQKLIARYRKTDKD